MNTIQELEKAEMDIVRELAVTNLKISEAKNIIFSLQENETKYLEEREQKALSRIQKILEESEDIVTKTHQNHENIHQFCQKISEYADFLFGAQKKFETLIEIFKARNEIWDQNVKNEEIRLAGIRKVIEIDQKAIEKRQEAFKEIEKSLKEKAEHIESQQMTLKMSYETEKKLWNQIQSKKN